MTFGLAVVALTAVTQGLATTAIAPATSLPAGLRDDGLGFAVGILCSALAGGGLLLWLLRRHSPLGYLAVIRPGWSTFALWIAIAALTTAAVDGLTFLLGRPLVPDAWFAIFHATRGLPVLLFALVVVAPIYEEMYFRGFLHRGLAASRIGPYGAVAAIAALFSLAHFPEDAWTFTQGLVTGALLGAARQHSGSIIPCIAIHALLNAKVMIQLAAGAP